MNVRIYKHFNNTNASSEMHTSGNLYHVYFRNSAIRFFSEFTGTLYHIHLWTLPLDCFLSLHGIHKFNFRVFTIRSCSHFRGNSYHMHFIGNATVSFTQFTGNLYYAHFTGITIRAFPNSKRIDTICSLGGSFSQCIQFTR